MMADTIILFIEVVLLYCIATIRPIVPSSYGTSEGVKNSPFTHPCYLILF